ncbi:hypothetical protein FKM82_023252 [Ascaphus truei]
MKMPSVCRCVTAAIAPLSWLLLLPPGFFCAWGSHLHHLFSPPPNIQLYAAPPVCVGELSTSLPHRGGSQCSGETSASDQR